MSSDPENPPSKPIAEPYSIYTPFQKGLLVLLVSLAATFSGFASNIYFPAIPTIASNLSVSTEAINLTVTSYMIFQGLSPTLWGAFSDVHGRRLTYICTFGVFLAACIGLAETRSYIQLIVLRCLQSTGSASTIAVGAGVLGDITTREERGGYMGYFQAGLLLPVAVGPVLGGVLTGKWGWRSVFWFLTIYGGVFLFFLVLLLPETLRSLVGNGSIPPKGIAESPLAALQRHRHNTSSVEKTTQQQQVPSNDQTKTRINFLTPVRILMRPEVTCAVLFVAIYYTVWQMVLTVTSTLFTRIYGLRPNIVGLVFIANGVGCMIGTILTGKVQDYDYRRIKKQFNNQEAEAERGDNGDFFPLERARLRTVYFMGALQVASVLVFGWTLQHHVSMAVPIICLFILGWAAISIQSAVSTFLVDVHPSRSASAMAALNLVRCLLGAGGVAAVMPCADAMGAGWTFTLFGGLMVLAFALLWAEMRFGGKWRRRSRELELGNQS